MPGENIDRRKVLKAIGIGTIASAGSMGSAAAKDGAEKSKQISVLNGRESYRLVTQALQNESVTELLRDLMEKGLRPRIQDAVAKTIESDEISDQGVVIPFESKGRPEGQEGVTPAFKKQNVTAYLAWSKEDKTAVAFVYGSGEELSDLSADRVKPTGTASDRATDISIEIITRDTHVVDSVENITAPSKIDRNLVGAGDIHPQSTDKNPKDCFQDNVGNFAGALCAIDCGACLMPGEGLGVGDVIQCIACLVCSDIALCFAGWCSDGHNNLCDICKTSLKYAWLVPPAPGVPLNGAQIAAAASQILRGCNADEGSDCVI